MTSRFTFGESCLAWAAQALKAVLVLFCLSVASWMNAQPAPAARPADLKSFIGKPAPRFVVSTLDGKSVTLGDYRGKAVVVNFWATWCGNCKLEMPWLAQLRNQYAGRGFEVLGILTDNAPRDRIAAITQKYGVRYPILMCNHTTAQAYGGLAELPESFFIDRRGRVVAEMDGADSKAAIEADIRKALLR